MTTTEKNKLVYNFKEGNKDLKMILGGKGANLGEMTNLGLNIPQGFTITTEACLKYFEEPEKVMNVIKPLVIEHLKELENLTKKKLPPKQNFSHLEQMI